MYRPTNASAPVIRVLFKITALPSPDPALPALQEVTAAEAITEIRRVSGLTWDQIGEIFEVDRRTAQFWASGRPLRPIHQELVMKAYTILRRSDCGNPDSTRAFLLDASSGPSLKDLLTAQDWVHAEARVHGRVALPRPEGPPRLSPREREVRRPLPVAEMMGASDLPLQHPGLETARIRQARKRVQ
jgi:hypothetical protein